MTDELGKELDITEEELVQHLLTWADNVQLTVHEVASIKNSILDNFAGYHKGWLERMSAQIDQTMARSQRRIDQAVSLQLQFLTDRTDRQLNTRS